MNTLLRVALYGSISLLFIACRNEPGEKTAQPVVQSAGADSSLVILTPMQLRNAGIITAKPEMRQMQTSLVVSGVIDVPPANEASVTLPLGGYIKQMSIIPGQQVKKGSVLAIVEDQQVIQLQQDYLVASNRMQTLEADYRRQETLNQAQVTSNKVFQQVSADFREQQIMVRAFAEKLRLIGVAPEKLTANGISRTIMVKAPINGFVTAVLVKPGAYVTPSQVLFELTDPSDLHLQLTVFENDAASLRVGQRIMCSTNNDPGTLYEATIHFITPRIAADRSTSIHCHLDNHDSRLFPGTSMNATITTSSAQAPAVPDEAVVKWENKNYVFTAEQPDRFRLLPVETAATQEGYTALRSAIPAAPIVIRNAYTLLMKMKNGGD